MTSSIRLTCLIRCKFSKLRSTRFICDSHFQLNRQYSHVSWKPTNCLTSPQTNLLNSTKRRKILSHNVAWSSTSVSSTSSSSDGLDVGPLNLSKIAEELAKLSNADKSGASPAVAEDSIPIADIDLTEFTYTIDTSIPETLLTASDIGLTWFAPTNVIFKSLMTIHESLPWWASIVALTVCVRMILFPLMVRNMKAASNISKNAQSLEEHRLKFRAALEAENQPLQIKTAISLLDAMKKNQITVFKSIAPMILMGVVFSSNFFALRAMANYPIESMKSEGLYWFTNLTLPDPYYVLPTLTSVTLYYVMISGNETAAVDPLSAKALQIMPMIICPVVVIAGATFPAALSTYWFSNNLISLAQGYVLRRTKIREFLQIPDQSKAPKEMSQGAFQSTVDMQKDIQLAAEIVKKLYQARMSEDIKLKADQLKKDKVE